MSTGTLRNDEIVAFLTIENIPFGLLTEINLPEPDVDHQTRPKPLADGSWSSGGRVTYGDITGSREIDWPADEALVAQLKQYEGGKGAGSCAFHAAPGHVVSTSPLARHTYDIVLLSIAIKDGVNAKGDGHLMVEVKLGVNGVGR